LSEACVIVQEQAKHAADDEVASGLCDVGMEGTRPTEQEEKLQAQPQPITVLIASRSSICGQLA